MIRKCECVVKDNAFTPCSLVGWLYWGLTLPKRQFFYSSKLKEFADDNFKLDENGTKMSRRVENTVGKGEIARYEQFLIFPQCFQKTCPADM